MQNCSSIDALEITGPSDTPAGAIQLSYTECGEDKALTASFASEYNGAHLVLGAYHIWVDATGDLRIKSSAPTSATDGAVVGDQTA